MNMPDTNIDELLNSFIDGEVTDDQRANMERLIESHPQIAQRLRQFQKTKMLVSSLPRHKAPRDIVGQVKATLEASERLAEHRLYENERAGTRQLLVRRILTAAAMIALVAVLGGVIYSILVPETAPEGSQFLLSQGSTGGVRRAAFSGRLELTTPALVAVDAFINGAIEGNGLSDYVTITRQPTQRLYSLNCSRQDLNLLLADLQGIWQKFHSAALYVDTEQFNAPVVVDAVTAEQTAKVLNQDSPRRSVEVARDIAILNNMSELMPGKQFLAAIDDKGVDLIAIPKPVLTGDRKTTEKTGGLSDHRPEVSLTIVIAGSE